MNATSESADPARGNCYRLALPGVPIRPHQAVDLGQGEHSRRPAYASFIDEFDVDVVNGSVAIEAAHDESGSVLNFNFTVHRCSSDR